MAAYNCSSCEDLRETDPNLFVNGIGESECASLANDTGLVPSDDHNDCTDLNNINDCLIGNMERAVDAESSCDWKPFAKGVIHNTWTTFKALICAVCGIWEHIHEIIIHLNAVSYIQILTLYRTSTVTSGSTATKQILAFNAHSETGNLPGVLYADSDGKGITIQNTTDVPLLVETLFNCSIRTKQRLASCYIVICRDGYAVGQTPFITPTTYDQQVQAEPFILPAGSSAHMTYYFGVGNANDASWFENLFYDSDGRDARMCLEARDTSDPENQRSYFTVRVTSIVNQYI